MKNASADLGNPMQESGTCGCLVPGIEEENPLHGRHRFTKFCPAFLLLCLALVAAASTSSRGNGEESLFTDRHLKHIYLAWESNEGGVIAITGSGKKILELKPPPSKSTNNSRELYQYCDPAIDPTGTALLYVEMTLEFEEVFSLGNSKETARLVKFDLRTHQQKILMTMPEGSIASPAYSIAGDKIALLVGRDFVVLDARTASEVARLPNALMGPVSCNYNRAYVRWSPFANDRICMDSSRNCGLANGQVNCGGVGEIELEGSAARWPPKRESSAGTTKGTSPADDQKRSRKSVFEVLLESGMQPKPAGSWSPAGRYYFYYAGKSGLFCRDWVEGYDFKKRRTFHVRTLKHHFYCA